ncbi:hypothetical protein AAG906_021069 [Vitis piasezkii]
MMIPIAWLWRERVEKSPYHPSLSIEQRQIQKWTWKVKEQKHRTLIEKGILIKNRNEMRLMRTERK